MSKKRVILVFCIMFMLLVSIVYSQEEEGSGSGQVSSFVLSGISAGLASSGLFGAFSGFVPAALPLAKMGVQRITNLIKNGLHPTTEAAEVVIPKALAVQATGSCHWLAIYEGKVAAAEGDLMGQLAQSGLVCGIQGAISMDALGTAECLGTYAAASAAKKAAFSSAIAASVAKCKPLGASCESCGASVPDCYFFSYLGLPPWCPKCLPEGEACMKEIDAISAKAATAEMVLRQAAAAAVQAAKEQAKEDPGSGPPKEAENAILDAGNNLKEEAKPTLTKEHMDDIDPSIQRWMVDQSTERLANDVNKYNSIEREDGIYVLMENSDNSIQGRESSINRLS